MDQGLPRCYRTFLLLNGKVLGCIVVNEDATDVIVLSFLNRIGFEDFLSPSAQTIVFTRFKHL